MSKLPHIVRQRLGVPSPRDAGADHPDADLLNAFAERQLAAPERERVLAHMSTCAVCREVVALAAPESVATQPVLTPARTRSWWSIRSYQYGALAAALGIAAVGLVLLRPDRGPELRKVAQVAAVPQTNASTARKDAPAEMQGEPAARPEEQTRIAGGGSGDRPAARKSFTVAAPSAAPPKELDKLANDSDAFQSGRTDVKSDRAAQHSNAMAYNAAPLRDTAKPPPASPAHGERETAGVSSSDLAAAAPTAKTAPAQPPTASARVASQKDANAPQTAEVNAASDVVTTESATPANALASQESGAAAGHLTATLQRAPLTRAGGLAKTEEDKQQALARDPNYNKRTATWRINNGRLQKLDPTRHAFDDVAVSGTSRLSVVASLGNEVWVGGTDGALHYSNDQGAHWITVSSGGWPKDATFTGITPTALRSVEVHLSNGQRWRSADAGASWSRYQ